jgi:hypothetical protein
VFRPRAIGACRVTASVAGVSSDLELLVASDVQPADRSSNRLEAAITAHGGRIVKAGQEDELAARIREVLTSRDKPHTVYPMRSPLWILPLLACLGGEWWLRRRAANVAAGL